MSLFHPFSSVHLNYKKTVSIAEENKSDNKIDCAPGDHGLYHDLFCLPKLCKVISTLFFMWNFLFVDLDCFMDGQYSRQQLG